MRILIASQPITGHVLPLLPIARELVRRGHALSWYTGSGYAAQVEAVGAEFLPFVHARDFDDADLGATFPERNRHRGLRQLQHDVQQIFVGGIEGNMHDLREIHRAWPADAVLADQTLVAALLHAESGGPPCALLGVLPLGIQSRDTAPFGLGLPPSATVAGRVRNRALHWLTQQVVFGAASRDLSAACRRMGVRERPFALPPSPHLMLQPTVPAFEYPQSDLPRSLHFIGPITPPSPLQVNLPAWWPDLLESPRPVVLVTQGTLATNRNELIVPAVRALENEDVLVIVAGAAGLDPLPINARAAAFIPFAALLPHVSVYVTNGGYGGVQSALAHGVPVVVAGSTEDKSEVGGRVAHAGVGLNLRTARPAPERLRRAVLELLGDSPQRRRAQAMGAEMRRHDAPSEAATLVAELARTGRAIERKLSP
ncbi:glycosyltransferase [Deinococcus humi]|uniref:MGT family glycosyltransferase n=1 Tax=Deinococcus humi TaxID=662880 RepID=A0A7W8JTN4_9DEIO|nr:nucleotide disphospho-sugar-binding domain-containing protein [Deinococcus humi]MBB5363006.1 MGT family glycosyltransferase [Deinococcus humi]GGO25177.1 glycosyl transferase [Deinococcus humi]